ncbi:MAG: two pore domain potassium channel family protein [Deltaproteobacteria bacterium]|nr:two pore domain potassium channel family protein [Deltaproteobacteria bacterium]
MKKEFYIPFTRIQIGRFLFLFISIVLVFVLRPFLESLVGIRLLVSIFFTLILLSGVFAVHQSKGPFIAALIMALLAGVGLWSYRLTEITAFGVMSHIVSMLFLGYLAAVILGHIFREKEITADMIMGAICVYFLLGWLWADIYGLLEMLKPGSFRPSQGSGVETWDYVSGVETWDYVYFSFVTLTTLGYGDVTPVSSAAQSFAILEAVTGQLFIAVLIARLVGTHISQSRSKESQ